MKQQRIYLDNAATTPLAPEVLQTVIEAYQSYIGNPSSIHTHGRMAKTALEKARKQIAQIIGAGPGEIYFTSGGTEANNTALMGAVRDLGIRRIISSRLEHPSVLNMLNHLQTQYTDLIVHWIKVDDNGAPLPEDLDTLLGQSQEETLVSLMHANNETGTLTDLASISQICHDHHAILHTDTVQTMGYYPLDIEALNVGFLSASAHKFYGPKGVGFLYMSNANIVRPLLYGGQQERGIRSGTENIAGILGLAKALTLMEEHRAARKKKIIELREYLIKGIRLHLPQCTLEHDNINKCHYKIVNMALPPSPKAELAVINLDIAGISISGGSACSSGAEKTSHVMEILHPADVRKHIRVSFSHHNTIEEIDELITQLSKII